MFLYIQSIAKASGAFVTMLMIESMLTPMLGYDA